MTNYDTLTLWLGSRRVVNNLKWSANLSRHSEVEGPNGGNETWHDEGNDQTLEHVQEQFARIAHIAGRQKSYKLPIMYARNYLACLDV